MPAEAGGWPEAVWMNQVYRMWSYRMSFKDSDAFDVGRVWEHVQRLHRTQVISRMDVAQDMQVARQRRWIAGYIDDATHRVARQGIEYRRLAARARRVYHQPIE